MQMSSKNTTEVIIGGKVFTLDMKVKNIFRR